MKFLLISILVMSTRASAGQTTVMSPAAQIKIEENLDMARWTIAVPSIVEKDLSVRVQGSDRNTTQGYEGGTFNLSSGVVGIGGFQHELIKVEEKDFDQLYRHAFRDKALTVDGRTYKVIDASYSNRRIRLSSGNPGFHR